LGSTRFFTTDAATSDEAGGPPRITRRNNFGLSLDQTGSGGETARQRKTREKKKADDEITGVDFDAEWNMQEDYPEVGTDNLLAQLNDSIRVSGNARERKSSGLGPPEPKLVQMNRDEYNRASDRGSRKRAVAQVYIKEGSGEHFVNGIPYTEYFPHLTQRRVFVDPFAVVDRLGQFDVWASVKGGGWTGQSGAIGLGIARALQNFDPAFRPKLRKEGLLTVDIRKVERKKFGRKKARKMKQWVKR
jgi:small subunit ribosomal protein S9